MSNVGGASRLARKVVHAALLALCAAGGAAHAGELESAEAALNAGQVAIAEAAFQRLALDDAAPARARAEAGVAWALLAWRIDGQAATAAQRLALLRITPDSLCPLAAARLRLWREAARLDELRATLSALPPGCGRAADLQRLQLQAAAGWLLMVRRGAVAERADAYRAGMLQLGALDDLGALDIEASQLALAYAIAAGDAAAAETAWRAHFRGTGSAAAEGLDLAQVFQRGLSPASAVTERLPLLNLLIKGGFADGARAFIDSHRLQAVRDPRARAAGVYLVMRAELEATAGAFNRAQARARSPSTSRYEAALKRSLAKAAQALARRGGADVAATLRREFGLWTSTGLTNGVWSLHAGHVVSDQAHAVSQFGQEAKVRLVVLDQMIANGYATWVSDGAATVGGWAVDGATIVHVRAPYEAGALRRLALRRGGAERAEGEQREAALAAGDARAATQTPLLQLPGLRLRLRRQAVDQVDELAQRRAGAQATPRQRALAFLSAWTEQEVARAIVIHEGRHVLDQRRTITGPPDGAELERRAKLSELQFGPFPRAAFASINDGLTGSDSPHGTANTQIMAGYRAWIETHGQEIDGLDPTQPALTQLDRLSDTQLRRVAATLDPGYGPPEPVPAAAQLRQVLKSWRQVWDAVRHRLVRP
jgi:hypothetical protein